MIKKFMLLSVILSLGLGSALHAGDDSKSPQADPVPMPMFRKYDSAESWDGLPPADRVFEEVDETVGVAVAGLPDLPTVDELFGEEAEVRIAVKRSVPDPIQSVSQRRRIDPSAAGAVLARVCLWQGCPPTAFATVQEFFAHVNAHCVVKGRCLWSGCRRRSECKSSFGLVEHIHSHTGEKPYMCDYDGCGMAFSRADILAEHTYVHTGEKRFACDFAGCDKAFAKSFNLKAHKESVHRMVAGEGGK